MGDNINTGSKGVFPTNGERTEGSIQPVAVVKPAIAPTATVIAPTVNEATVAQEVDISHHDEVVESVGNKIGATYSRLEVKNDEGQISGIIELDLISFREKGEENRYLSFQTEGVDDEGNQIKIMLAINNETDFNIFKNFVSNLNWND